MFIEIESSLKVTPKLLIKRERNSKIIKKSQIRIYNEAQSLLKGIEEQLSEYQSLIKERTIEIIKDKENEVNQHVSELRKLASEELTCSQQIWFEKAEEQLTELLNEQERNLNSIVDDVRKNIISAINSRLHKMNQSDKFIGYLTDALHAELDDIDKSLSVTHSFHDLGSILTIENENSLVRIDTQELLHELKSCLENTRND